MIGGRRKAILVFLLLLPLLVACSFIGQDPTPTAVLPTLVPEAGLGTGSATTPLTTPHDIATADSGLVTGTPPEAPTGQATGTGAAQQGQETPSAVPPTAAPDEEEQPSPSVVHDLAITADDIVLLPVPAVYAGDLVTFHVAPNLPRGLAPNDVQVRILLDGQELLLSNVNYRKLSGEVVGLYQWAWDTTDQEGAHTITVELDPQDLIQINDENPDNNTASINMIVRPRELLPESQANASWVAAESDCCILHVVSGTAAERDIEQLKTQVDDAFDKAAAALTTPLSPEPYDVYIIGRVIGQGGYAMRDMVVSYVDRDYVGGGLEELLVHEAVHLIDRQFAPDRVTFLAEGLAVWAAGGHYHQQDLSQRMAALLELDDYVPLSQLIDSFFSVQHEIGYLEASSLVEYLVKTYGWPQVRSFYGNTSAGDGLTVTDAVDINMRATFGRTLDQLEADWLAYLSSLPKDPAAIQGLEITIHYYDVMRRYQTLFDPTAYYLYAWLPAPAEAARRQTTADFNRHPESEVNIALESMLLSANAFMWQGQYDRTNALLDSVTRVLNNEGTFLDPLARSYLDIVRAVTGDGYVVQRIDLDSDRASVIAARPDTVENQSLELTMKSDRTWSIKP
jgi:hypothetical protein